MELPSSLLADYVNIYLIVGFHFRFLFVANYIVIQQGSVSSFLIIRSNESFAYVQRFKHTLRSKLRNDIHMFIQGNR